jgi:hypothetical protein
VVEDFEAYLAVAWPRLLRSAWLLTGDWHLAEDLVQTVLARAQRAPPGTDVPAWTVLWRDHGWIIGVTVDPADPSPDRDELTRVLNGLVRSG